MAIETIAGFPKGLMLEKEASYEAENRSKTKGGPRRMEGTRILLSPYMGNGTNNDQLIRISSQICDECPLLSRGCSGIVVFERSWAGESFERALVLGEQLVEMRKGERWIEKMKKLIGSMQIHKARCIPNKWNITKTDGAEGSSQRFVVTPA